ncbi:MAG: amidohydrolase family protein [Acidimicrobiales bacterium]
MSPTTATRTLITGARLFTGVDGEVIDDGTVVVDGGTIAYAGPTVDAPPVDDATVVDVAGRFVMPGMTESHVHLAYANAAPTRLNSSPVQIAMLDAVDNARVLLGSGFTSAISFGAAQGTDVPLRDAIEAGRVPGPRLLANDRDVGSTGSNADSSSPGSEGLKLIADGPWAVRAAVRELAKKRCDVVKLFLDGESLNAYAPPGMLTYTDEEVAACIDEAHMRGLRVVTHSRSAAAVKQAVRHGADIIGHGNYLDDEAVDMLRAVRDRVFVGPGIAWEITLLERGNEIGLPRATMEAQGYQREVDETISAVKRLREAGVRVLVGGDYGLNICPHGTNAKDLQYFVELFGMTPTEALLCATRDGGTAFDPGGMVGTLVEGTHADLVVVDGDPTVDVTVLQDHARLPAVMKAGVWYQDLVGSDPAFPLSLPTRWPAAHPGRKRESGV